MNHKTEKNVSDLCVNCPKFACCTVTCEGAESYARQDHVAMRETQYSPASLDQHDSDIGAFWSGAEIKRMTKEENQLLRIRFRFTHMQLKILDLLFWQKKSPQEGSKYLKISRTRVSQIIKAIKEKIEKKRYQKESVP
jgi:hypothetical protein